MTLSFAKSAPRVAAIPVPQARHNTAKAKKITGSPKVLSLRTINHDHRYLPLVDDDGWVESVGLARS
ncbi:aspartyl/glutamyl-tRNA amidotransferase subunit B [Anopheles sinensis]|uniref:Aspartyl/glutamyl-tRNA amidotransferase subunit B n=1 Tax=Anopheles sinensis TaxID=74873 RepID=A0A084VMR8_ANOSI|nr:aspartyl/glutamyl-tRNA amidotransferase subunit B [Anopheles sinensis]